jgi:hypothetical protein
MAMTRATSETSSVPIIATSISMSSRRRQPLPPA